MDQREWMSVFARTEGVVLQPGQSGSAIDAAAEILGSVFPVELRSLYLATDGVFDTNGR